MLNNPLYFGAISILVSSGFSLIGETNKPLGLTCFIVAVVMSVLSIIVSIVRWCQLPERAKFSLRNLCYFRWDGRISLRRAAQIIYSEARAQDSLWAHAAERLSLDKSPDGILCYIAEIMKQDTAFFGKRPPSTQVEQLDAMRAMYGTVTNGARELRMRDDTHTVFIDLQVETKELHRALREVRENLKHEK